MSAPNPYSANAPVPQQPSAQPVQMIGEVRVWVKAAQNVPGDTTFTTLSPYVTVQVGQTVHSTTVGFPGKNPVWQTPAMFPFEIWPGMDNMTVQIVDKQTSVFGSTRVKSQALIPLNQFKMGHHDMSFQLPGNCTLLLTVEFVNEVGSRTVEVNNLRPGTKEEHVKEIFGQCPGGVDDVFLDQARNSAYVEFKTRQGYFAAFNVTQQIPDLVIKPAVTTPDAAEKDVTIDDFKNNPAAASKKLFNKTMGFFKKP
eukprot:ANDGO_01643.mRNA.1 hypothetical protein